MKQPRITQCEKCVAVVCLVVTVAAVVSCVMTIRTRSDSRSLDPDFYLGESANSVRDAAPAGAHHDRLRFVVDLSGVDNPQFMHATSTKLDTSDEVVGLIIAGKAFAFSRRAMSSPSTHIINFNVAETPISVTYCNLVDQARVLSGPSGPGRNRLRVGGLDVHRQLVFLLDEKRYGQTSSDLPLKDYPFERMTLAEWVAKHPDSSIYEG